MGRLLDGKWTTHDMGTDERGRYVRRATQFRDWVTPKSTERNVGGASYFPAEAGRYHLYVSNACPWCHRVMIVRSLLGLQEVVDVSSVEPFMGDEGWTFAEGADPVGGHDTVYEIYLATQSDYTGRASVPVLLDTQSGRIVSNESSDLVRMFDGAFEALVGKREPLFPAELDEAIRTLVDASYDTVNNGVYRAGFAGNQQAHVEAVGELFGRLDELETLLATSRYLCGDRLTGADICLFPTLYRFDSVYAVHFKCNLRRLVDYPNLWAYTRDVYQTPGVAETCLMAEIKTHYYTSHESINPRRLVPVGPELDFDEPHGRERLMTVDRG
jgi:glutathionyl-hydroquinone reductase